MLYKCLKFFRIKDQNKFVSLFFAALTCASLAYLLVLFTSLIFGNGELAFYPSPYLYAAMLLFPVFSYSYGINSKLIVGKPARIKWYIIAASAYALIFFSFITTVINNSLWYIVKHFASYATVKSLYPELFGPAFKTASLFLPFIWIFYILDYFLLIPRDDDRNKGIAGFGGLSINSPKSTTSAAFLCNNIICYDIETTNPIVVDEKKRMESTLVEGATGTGKTAMVLLPMSSRDIEKKFFLREYSKKIAFEILKNGTAYLDGPYTNEYININFNLDYIKPKKGKEEAFYNALKDIILFTNEETNEVIYRNVGVTVVENDGNYVSTFTNVAKNFDMEVLTVDPINPNTMSMNPFAIEDPAKVASIIADVLKSMQQSEGGKEEVFFSQVTSDAFQNLSILLKEMYPRLNNGRLPSLEDVLELLYNFDKVEELTEDMKKIPELFEKYKLLIAYFEKNFYKPSLNINGYEIPGTRGSGRKDTERFLYGAITQLNNLLRHPGIKRALCGRENVINFDTALKEGQIITACSRKGELGVINSKAFGMFFILQFQDAVLRRKGSEDSRIPHFLYIDEFPEYMNKDTEVMFTLFRKYRCGVIIAIQNLSQLEKNKGFEYYRQVVLANTKTQIVFGDTVPEDSEYWNKAFGQMKKVDVSSTYDPTGGDFVTKKSIQYKDKERFKTHKISEHKFGEIYYKTKAPNGNTVFGEGKVNFLDAKYNEKHPTFLYNFEKYMINKPLKDTEITGFNVKTKKSTNASEDTTDNKIYDSAIAANISEEDGSVVVDNYNTDKHNESPIVEKKNSKRDSINEESGPVSDFNFDDDGFDIIIDTGEDNN